MFIETTSIYHDSETKTDVTSCPEPGCYNKSIIYSATMRQMVNLADISASCKQYIKVNNNKNSKTNFIRNVSCLNKGIKEMCKLKFKLYLNSENIKGISQILQRNYLSQ